MSFACDVDLGLVQQAYDISNVESRSPNYVISVIRECLSVSLHEVDNLVYNPLAQ